MADQQNTPDAGAVGRPESIVNGVFGGTEQVKSFADNTQHFLDEAKAGRWAVDEETGTHILSGVAHAQQQLNEIGTKTYLLQQAPKLGKDAYAEKVSQHMLASVDSDEQSLLHVFRALKDGLDNLREAVETAIKKYDASDEAATKHFTSFQS